MKILACTLAAVASLTSVVTYAQTAKDVAQSLEDTIIKKQRYPRGFSADPEIHWRWKDGALIADAPSAHIFSAIVAKSVKSSGNKIEIVGNRYAIFCDKNQKLGAASLGETVRVTVDLTGADIGTLLPHIVDTLFYRDVNDALSNIPSIYEQSVPSSVDAQGTPSKKPPVPGCDCADAADKKCGDPDSLQNAGAKAPKLIYSVEPEFSEEARRHKFSGGVQTGIAIDSSGNVSDVWVIRPAGMGLDQAATSAVRQYRFNPATCHGQPMVTHLYIDVTFQIF